MTANDRRIQALKLARHCRGMNLTHHANVLLSRQAPALLREGLIAYGSGSVAYVLTSRGEAELAKHCDAPGCFASRGTCRH